MDLSKYVQVAVLGSPQGIKGFVRLKSYTDPLTNICNYQPLYDKDKNEYIISTYHIQKGSLIVKFEKIDDRGTAENLKNKILYADKLHFLPTEEEEYYHIDLVDLPVYDSISYEKIGKKSIILGYVTNVSNFGAGDLLEIAFLERQNLKKSKIFVPFTRWMVPEISVTEKYVTICIEKLDLFRKENDKEKIDV